MTVAQLMLTRRLPGRQRLLVGGGPGDGLGELDEALEVFGLGAHLGTEPDEPDVLRVACFEFLAGGGTPPDLL